MSEPLPTTVQFSGETAFDAIINHNCLDIVEEDDFITFLNGKGYKGDLYKTLPLLKLEKYFDDWCWNKNERG